jgi:hypothetical protein
MKQTGVGYAELTRASGVHRETMVDLIEQRREVRSATITKLKTAMSSIEARREGEKESGATVTEAIVVTPSMAAHQTVVRACAAGMLVLVDGESTRAYRITPVA